MQHSSLSYASHKAYENSTKSNPRSKQMIMKLFVWQMRSCLYHQIEKRCLFAQREEWEEYCTGRAGLEECKILERRTSVVLTFNYQHSFHPLVVLSRYAEVSNFSALLLKEFLLIHCAQGKPEHFWGEFHYKMGLIICSDQNLASLLQQSCIGKKGLLD